MTTQTRRESLIRALTYRDLKDGKGTHRQQAAFQELEWRRCAADFEYFRVNYCHIILKSGDILPWTEPYPMQVSAVKEWLEGESTIEVKARQLGETTNGTHFALWECLFREAVIWNFFGADDDASKDMKRRLDATLDRLPSWMLSRARMTEGGSNKRKDRQDAATILTFGLSTIRVFTGSVKKAQGLTGKTLWDDAGKHIDPERKWQLLYPTIDDPDPANRGQLIIIFNGNGEDFLYHLYQKAKAGQNNLTAHFYSWRDDPRRMWAPDEHGVGPHCVIAEKREYYPWYENAKQQYLVENPDKDTEAFKAQYPETEDEAFYISSDSRFDSTKLQGYSLVIKRHPRPKIGYLEGVLDENGENIGWEWHTHGSNGNIRLFEPPADEASYIVGVDPAGGHADSDYSVMQVCRLVQGKYEVEEALKRVGYDNPPTVDGKAAFEVVDNHFMLEQVMTYQARTEPAHLAHAVEKVGEWYNDALVVVESIAHGGTVLDHLKQTYWNLYREERNEKFTDEETERLGFWPQAHKKTQAIDNLAAWLSNAWLMLRDGASVNELRIYGYQQSAAGAVRLGAPKGMHDDLVIGLALCVVGARSLAIERSAHPVKRFGLEW